jgi:hypothetical protein
MIEKNVIIEVRKLDTLSWEASWRPEDDVYLQCIAWSEIQTYGLNKVSALTRKRVIKRAFHRLQGRIDREVASIKRAQRQENSMERVEITLDVTALRELENA